jgi:hypothetical protein
MKSLQASIVPLAKILGLNPHALYERQLALVKAKLLQRRPGHGPGSGTPFSTETVTVLFISMLATDGIEHSAEKTSGLSAVRSTRKNTFGGAETFKAAMINALSSDAIISQIRLLRINRQDFSVEIWEKPSADKKTAAHFFFPETSAKSEGVAFVVEVSGPVLEKVRALLRNSEVAAAKAIENKRPVRKLKSKVKS